MYENGGEIVIGGKPYPAIFNVAALEEITTRYGGLDGLAEEFKKDPAKAIGEIAWVIELLTTQGAALKNLQEGTEIKVPSSRDIKVLMKPKELMKQQDLIIEIINAGMGDEDERADEEIEIDEVLEEIEASKRNRAQGLKTLAPYLLGLRCGLTEKESWMTTPGRILTLWKWTIEYDEYLHWIKRKKKRPGGED